MCAYKARAIFTNDAECDDMNSLLHLLLYANDIDIEGLVLSSSCFHYEGDPAAGDSSQALGGWPVDVGLPGCLRAGVAQPRPA